MIAYSSEGEELKLLEKVSKENQPIVSGDKWMQEYYQRLSSLQKGLNNKSVLDIMLYDVVPKESLKYLKSVRQTYDKALLMVIADNKISPLEYVNPNINSTSLIIRPSNEHEINNKVRELFDAYSNLINSNEEDILLVESRESTVRVPINKIYYIEANNKKVVVSTENEEYEYYNTLNDLEQKLGTKFVRCHRGFIISRDKIKSMALSKGIIYMKNGAEIPVSRTYKKTLKEMENFDKSNSHDA